MRLLKSIKIGIKVAIMVWKIMGDKKSFVMLGVAKKNAKIQDIFDLFLDKKTNTGSGATKTILKWESK